MAGTNSMSEAFKKGFDQTVLKITTKMKARDTLIVKMFEQWENDNPGLKEDVADLVSKIMTFNLKWGAKLNPTDFIKKR